MRFSGFLTPEFPGVIRIICENRIDDYFLNDQRLLITVIMGSCAAASPETRSDNRHCKNCEGYHSKTFVLRDSSHESERISNGQMKSKCVSAEGDIEIT